MNLNRSEWEDAFPTVTLHRFDATTAFETEAEELHHLEDTWRMERFYDETRRVLIQRFHRAIYGLDHPSVHLVTYPENWWEAFKERWAPDWFHRRYPVRYTEITTSLRETYPQFTPALPDTPAVIQIAVRKKPRLSAPH